ncbi:MAG: insulinase family protein [Deltaproteobacteria bacterium]|nr:MAG: insulinase family protein [Deltaproteobacteria bacterium]
MTRLPLVLALALVACPEKAPVEAAADAVDPLAVEMPLDPGVRAGKLDNGMRYYVENNDQPQNRAVFRLVVEAGSVLEDDDQLGLAHFLEHMAFNGTEHFEGNELIAYLESAGTRFGAHLNAHTSFDETVYKLQVPTDDAEVFDKAFVIMEDWAHGMKLDGDEIEKERGVVLEEWRRGLGANRRSWEVTMPAQYPDSPYPDRLPIGTEDSLKTFEHEAVSRFYNDWYRPDLMSLIVVGSVDVDAVEQKIIEQFGKLEMPAEPRERVFPEVADSPAPTTVIFTDPELTGTSLSLNSTEDWVLGNTRREYRDGFVLSLATGALNERLADLAQDPESPFRGAGIGRSRLSPTEGSWGYGISPYEDKVVEAYKAALIELKRFREHGVTAGELERGVAMQMRGMKTYYEERETTPSRTHAEEIVRHVTTGEPMPGIAEEWAMAQEYLPTITIEEVNAVAATLFADNDHALILRMPEKEGLAVPTEADFAAITAEVEAMSVEPIADESVDAPLVAAPPAPGKIVEERTEEKLGFTVWTLSNGAEVWFKPTDFEAEEVLFSGRSEGGANRAAESGYVPAVTAASLRGASGLGELDARALTKALAGHSASASTWIGGAEEGVRGSAHPDDLELMFQQAWLAFTAPRWDEDALARDQKSRLERIANRDQNPNTAFSDAWTKLQWQDFELFRPWTPEHVAQMDLEQSKAFYADRFMDASDFRFTIVGSTDAETLKPLVEQWLASLPAVDREVKDARIDLGNRRPDGKFEETVRSGTDPKARVRMLFHGPMKSTFETRNQMQALGAVLSVRLREVLREDKGGVYGVSASAGVEEWPEQRYTVFIDFVCDPDRVPELEEATMGVLDELRAGPLDAHYVSDHVAKSKRGREEALRTNGFWLGLADATPSTLQFTGESLDEVLDYETRLDSLSPEVLHELAKTVLDDENMLHMVHLPAEDGAAEGEE